MAHAQARVAAERCRFYNRFNVPEITRKRKRSSDRPRPSSPSPAGFRAELERALGHVGDALWLGAHSPLAAPYLLNGAMHGSGGADDAMARGAALQSLLRDAAGSLALIDGPSNPRALLNLLFFDPPRHLNQAGLATRLGISTASLYRYRLEALDQLESAVAARVLSGLRQELPVVGALVGRERELTAGRELLRLRRLVGITGPSGVGKTALAASLAREWQPSAAVFWYTLRPGVNDHLESLLFALGDFLRRHGETALWLQLAADRGHIDAQLALSLAWSGLERMAARTPPVLCFDELDVLSPALAEAETRAALRHFVEALLRAPDRNFPALMIGQRLLIEPDAHVALHGLADAEAQALLGAAGAALSADELPRVIAVTGGNPLLLRLVALLRQSGDAAVTQTDTVLQPSLPVLLSRVVRRLDENARQALFELCVFDAPAPADAWQERRDGLDDLLHRGLAQADVGGAVALQPALRDAARQQLGPELRERMELFAASVRAARGEMTAAAAHWLRADRPDLAVRFWYAERAREIERGNRGAALALFAAVSRERLKSDDRRLLVALRSELRALSGDSEAAEEDLASVPWHANDSVAPRALELHGDMLVRLGREEHALHKYRAALEATDAQLMRKRAQLRAKLAGAYRIQRNLDDAEREAALARFEAESLQGDLNDERGRYPAAIEHYLRALAAATESRDNTAIARANISLGTVEMRLGHNGLAAGRFTTAIERYTATGDQVRLHWALTNLGFMHILTGDFASGIEHATRALAFFESVGNLEWIATNACNLAEAYVAIGRIDEAQAMAERALRLEDLAARPYALTALGRAYMARSTHADAERFLREAVAAAQEASDRWAEAPALRALALALRGQGKSSEASTAFDTALDIFTDLDLPREIERTRALMAQN